MKSFKNYIALLGLSMVIFSCDHEENIVPEQEINSLQIVAIDEEGLNISLLAQKPLEVGFNEMTLSIKNENDNPISGQGDIVPMMDMSTMKHSCPIEFPAGMELINGHISFNTVFVMPSGDMGSWSLNISVGDKIIELPIEVAQPDQSRMASLVSSSEDNETKYFICLLDPLKPEVGQNDLQVAIFKKQSMMEWPAVENLEIKLTPWMPSMDHGSPNNINPAHVKDGHYMGKVNFTMTGTWQINLMLKKKEIELGETYFEINF